MDMIYNFLSSLSPSYPTLRREWVTQYQQWEQIIAEPIKAYIKKKTEYIKYFSL